uniref:M56 family metallopeptidase n=1 Tax=Nocardia neocaledoniensis TaxID=236511 RepID=UPI002457C11A
MSVALCLLAYIVVVVVLAPPLLLRTAGDGQHPRLGLVAWVSAMVSALLSGAVAMVFLGVDVVRDLLADQHLDLGRCFRQLHDAASGIYGAAVQVGLWALAGLAVIAAAVAVWRLCGSLLRARSVTHQHAQAARMVGRPHDRHDAVVLDHPEPAAYSVAGNPHTIVLTQGIVATLDDEQLGAVMAHERAHLNGRHHLLLAFTRAFASVFRVELFVTGAAQVGRLVEMIADDAAADIYGPITVCEALLTLADSPGKAPVAATEVGLADRVRRLAEPPVLTRMNRFAASAAIAAVVVGPQIATQAAARSATDSSAADCPGAMVDSPSRECDALREVSAASCGSALKATVSD